MRRGARLLISDANRGVDADAMRAVVDDPELALLLLERTQRGHAQTAAELRLRLRVRRPDHHPRIHLVLEVVRDDVRALGRGLVVPRPLAGLPLVADMRRPVRLSLEDGGRTRKPPAPSKPDTRAVRGHDRCVWDLEVRADRADQLEVDAGGLVVGGAVPSEVPLAAEDLNERTLHARLEAVERVSRDLRASKRAREAAPISLAALGLHLADDLVEGIEVQLAGCRVPAVGWRPAARRAQTAAVL
eukprot:16451847-Heterocapsa_arctica.AAC.1